MEFGIGIRIVAFASFLLGVLLLGVCGWTYQKIATGEIGKNSTLAALDKGATDAASASGQKGPQTLVTEIHKISGQYADLQKEWKQFKPFLMGSGGVALAGGVVQVLTALALLCSGTKGARNRVGCFKITHFLVAVVLVAAIVVPASFDVKHDSLSHKLKVLLQQVKDEIHKSVTADGEFSPDVITAYYGVIATDIAGVLIIVLCTCCLMRNAEYDYRQYP